MGSMNRFIPDLYDKKISYVSKYGKDILHILEPKEGERILDLGCGTGDLTNDIALSGAKVIGMDSSEEMITHARLKYPEIDFITDNAESFQSDQEFDAIFSNAALHWIQNAENAVMSISNALTRGGRLAAEFGGKGNIETVMQGISSAIRKEHGLKAPVRNPWYFPSIGEYARLLEKHGLQVIFAELFDRPTELPDGKEGLFHWLDSLRMTFS